MSQNILVTGGLGFIGHRVTCFLEELEHTVSIIDTKTNYGIVPPEEINFLMAERSKSITSESIFNNDIVDSVGINALFTGKKFAGKNVDTIVHMASFPRQKVVNSNPQYGSEVMIGGLLNLLELAVKHNVKKFIYISSSMVYGDFNDQVTESAVCNPTGTYGILKLTGESLVKEYTRKHGIEHVIIRPSAVYGPLDVEDRVVSKFLISAMKGEQLRVNGASEMLDFTYVDDIARGIVQATIATQPLNNTYNLTRSRSRSLIEAAELAVQLAGAGVIQVNQRDAAFPSRGALNTDAAQKDFGYTAWTDIEVGFERYYEWLNNSVFWNKKTVQ